MSAQMFSHYEIAAVADDLVIRYTPTDTLSAIPDKAQVSKLRHTTQTAPTNWPDRVTNFPGHLRASLFSGEGWLGH